MKKLLFMRCSILRIVSALLTFVLLVSVFSVSVFATEIVASPTNSKITIDGVEVKFEAYNINGNNYFKLRDIAYSLTNTEKRFSVNWVAENNSANLITGEKYSPIGGEMNLGNNKQKNATLSNTNIMVNGKTVNATAYMIDNCNYFKLRDLGTLLDFGVDWDEQSQTVEIFSKTEDAVEVPKISVDISQFEREKVNLDETQSNKIDITGENEKVHQFLYKDEGLAYAYVEKNSDDLVIVLPNNKLIINKEYPILGDIISDDEGYIYVIWGKIADVVNNKKEQSIFVSKYSSNGTLELSRGVYDPRGENMHYISKEPFVDANTASMIYKGNLVFSFGKTIHEKDFQTGGVVAVKTRDLFPTEVPDWTKVYTAHCLGNDMVWNSKLNDFFFISQGSVLPRGFNISSARNSSVIFDFYLEDDANGDLDIINETFAQMGGLVYTENGFIFCGASVKSLSEDAKNENQNLFIQMFDIDWDGNVTYQNGEEREGMRSNDEFDNDSSTSSLMPVKNFGVQWLTDYSEKSVVKPQIVKADNKIVIIWSIYEPDNESCKKTAYMILSNEGEILVPETELDYSINSYEKPIYHNGVVSWVYYDTSSSQLHLVELRVE